MDYIQLHSQPSLLSTLLEKVALAMQNNWPLASKANGHATIWIFKLGAKFRYRQLQKARVVFNSLYARYLEDVWWEDHLLQHWEARWEEELPTSKVRTMPIWPTNLTLVHKLVQESRSTNQQDQRWDEGAPAEVLWHQQKGHRSSCGREREPKVPFPSIKSD